MWVEGESPGVNPAGQGSLGGGRGEEGLGLQHPGSPGEKVNEAGDSYGHPSRLPAAAVTNNLTLGGLK